MKNSNVPQMTRFTGVSLANDLVTLNDNFRLRADELFCRGEAGIDEYEACEKSLSYLKDEIETFEDKYDVKVWWDNNYTFNLYVTDRTL